MDFISPSVVLASDANRSALIDMELANLTKDVEEKIPFRQDKKTESNFSVIKENKDVEELATDR
jgi:hypothetical protein